MWADIARDLNKIDYSSLNEQDKAALSYINHQLKLAKKNITKIEANIALKDNRFTSFGDSFRTKNNITLHKTFMNDSFAMKIASSYSDSPVNGESYTRFDGSYIATYVGNWVISAGMQDRWWGQGSDSNLALTNNARPIPAIAITRKSAIPVTVPFTEIDIPWTVTTFMGIMDDERIIKDTLLWGFRLNFKPLEGLEIGLTRLAQWGGEGRPQDLSTFWNVFIGKDNCGAGGLDCLLNPEPGNQQAGYDFRYGFNLFDIQLALYGESLAEDGNDNTLSFLTEIQTQLGMEVNLNLFSQPAKIYFEQASTYTDCVEGSTNFIGNCFYEHHIYKTGMRYNQRTLGNLYDNDAKTRVLGLITSINQDTDLTVKLRHLELNIDDNDKAPNNPLIGNPLTKVAEEILMFSTKVQHSYKNWRFTLGVDLSKSKFTNSSNNKNTTNVFLNIEHNL
nr:capsule assembly Wzi family protein [Thalassotalea piscium]